jgi:hypothetical protein
VVPWRRSCHRGRDELNGEGDEKRREEGEQDAQGFHWSSWEDGRRRDSAVGAGDRMPCLSASGHPVELSSRIVDRPALFARIAAARLVSCSGHRAFLLGTVRPFYRI